MVLNAFGNTYQVRIRSLKYTNNGNLALSLESYEDRYGFWEPFCHLTTNTDDKVNDDEAIIKNTPEQGFDVEKFLITNEIGEPTGKTVSSGFCTYPIFKINLDKIKNLD